MIWRGRGLDQILALSGVDGGGIAIWFVWANLVGDNIIIRWLMVSVPWGWGRSCDALQLMGCRPGIQLPCGLLRSCNVLDG